MNKNAKSHIVTKKDVFRLDISMNDMQFVTIVQRVRNAQNIGCRTSFAETFTMEKFRIDLAFWSIFKNQIDSFLVPEVTVHT